MIFSRPARPTPFYFAHSFKRGLRTPKTSYESVAVTAVRFGSITGTQFNLRKAGNRGLACCRTSFMDQADATTTHLRKLACRTSH